MARISSTGSSCVSEQLLSLENESGLSISRNDSSSEILALFASGGNNGLFVPSTPESSNADKPGSLQEACIVFPHVNCDPSTDNTVTLSDRNHSKGASFSPYLEQMRLCNQLEGYKEDETDVQKAKVTLRNSFQYGDQRFHPGDKSDSPFQNQGTVRLGQGCATSQGTQSHSSYPSKVNMEDGKKCASKIETEAHVFALSKAGHLEIRNKVNEKNIGQPSKLWYADGAGVFHETYSQQTLYRDLQTDTRNRKREMSLWRPSKATIFFSTLPQDLKGQTQMDALFMNEAQTWEEEFRQENDTNFPSEHTLATSKDLNEAMRKVKALQQSKREMSKLFPRTHVASGPFSEKVNGLPDKSRFELQLKYRNILSQMKRQEYIQWEAETSSRAEKFVFPAHDETGGNQWPWQTGKVMTSRRRAPKRSPAQSQQSSCRSLFVKLEKSPLVTAVSCQSENETTLTRSRVKISDSSWSQENKQSFVFVRRELEQFNRVPKPSAQLFDGPLDINEKKSTSDSAAKLSPGKDNGQGDDVTSTTQRHVFKGDESCAQATRERGRGLPHRSPKRSTVEKRHHEKCTCAACAKTANWVHSMGFSCFSGAVEPEPMHSELKSSNAEKSELYSTTTSEVPLDASVSCVKVNHNPQKARSELLHPKSPPLDHGDN